MNKYVWSECTTDEWPVIKTCMATSYNDAVEKLIIKYGEKLDDDTILDTMDDWEDLRNYLNKEYYIALSDLEDYDEI